MSGFQIDLEHLEGKSVEKDFRPSAEVLEALFDDISEDYRLKNPEGFIAHVRAQMKNSAVHVEGRARAEFEYQCGRCLGAQPLVVDAEIDFVLMSEAEWSRSYAGKKEVVLNADDLDISFYSGDTIDLGELIREAIVLQLPAFPRCPAEQTEECEARYETRVGASTLEELDENSVDLRLSALKDLVVTEDGKLKKIDRSKKTD